MFFSKFFFFFSLKLLFFLRHVTTHHLKAKRGLNLKGFTVSSFLRTTKKGPCTIAFYAIVQLFEYIYIQK